MSPFAPLKHSIALKKVQAPPPPDCVLTLHRLQQGTQGSADGSNSSNHHGHLVGFITLLVCKGWEDLLVSEAT